MKPSRKGVLDPRPVSQASPQSQLCPSLHHCGCQNTELLREQAPSEPPGTVTRISRGSNERIHRFHTAIYCGPRTLGYPTHKSEGQGGTEVQVDKAGNSDPGGSGHRPIPGSSVHLHLHPHPYLPPPASELQVSSREQAASLPNRRHTFLQAAETIWFTFYK